MTKEELIEAAKNRSADSEYVKGFAERCRKREKEFAEQERRMRHHAAWYRFIYGVKNE